MDGIDNQGSVVKSILKSPNFYLGIVFVAVLLMVVVIIFKAYPSLGGTEFINYKDFTKGKYDPDPYAKYRKDIVLQNCYNVPEYLKLKCAAKGGELVYKTIGVGYSEGSSFGCFPKGETKDKGKTCGTPSSRKDSDCEGWCLWLNGDAIGPDNDNYTCSDFKKPYFIFGDRDSWSFVTFCGYSRR